MRETDRQTETERERETDSERDRQTERQTENLFCLQPNLLVKGVV